MLLISCPVDNKSLLPRRFFPNTNSTTQKLPVRSIPRNCAYSSTLSRLRCSASRIDANTCSSRFLLFSSSTSLLHNICDKSLSLIDSKRSNPIIDHACNQRHQLILNTLQAVRKIYPPYCVLHARSSCLHIQNIIQLWNSCHIFAIHVVTYLS